MLSQIKHVIEKDNQAIRQICMELFYNEFASSIMNEGLDALGKPELKNKLLKADSSVLTMNPFIHSIYYYNYATKRYYTSYYGDGAVVKDVFLTSALNRHSSVPVLQPLLRKINRADRRESLTEYVFSYVMCGDLTGYDHDRSAVIVNIRLEYFLDEIRDAVMSDRQMGDFFALITQDGVWFPDKEYTDSNSFVDYLTGIFLSKIMVLFHQGSKLGIITEKIEDTRYFISFIRIGGTSLTIIKSQPYEVVFRHLTETLYRISIVTTLAVFLAVLASILLSWRIYKPIGKLMHIVDENIGHTDELPNNDEIDFLRDAYVYTIRELKAAKHSQRVENDLKKQNFWIQLSKGALSPAEVKEAMEEKLIQTYLFSPFYLWIIKIDNYAKLREMSSRDYNLYKYAICNIMNEIISIRYACDLFEIEPDRFCVLVSRPEKADQANIYDGFHEAAKEGQHAVLRHLELYISLSFSELINDYTEFNDQYNLTSQNMQYRIIFGKMCVIHPDMVELNNQKRQYEYPFSLEESLLHEIKNGNLSEAEARLDLIILEIKKMDYNSIVISILRMHNMVYDALTEIYENNFVPISESLDTIGMNYLEQHTISDVRSKIWQEVKIAAKAVRDTSVMGKRSVLVNTISVLILSNYHDPSFCVASVAEMLDKAPNYIGSLYKEATGKSISQHILDTRMKMAEKLLLTTDYTIGKIIELTGFVNESSFYKNFKRHYGATPNTYKLRQKVEVNANGA